MSQLSWEETEGDLSEKTSIRHAMTLIKRESTPPPPMKICESYAHEARLLETHETSRILIER